MQALQRAAAVFCMACICAELVTLFVGTTRTARCIKALAGLYILAVLLSQLSGLPKTARMAAPSVSAPQTSSQWELTETQVLAQAEKQLETFCTQQCRQQFGVEVQAEITLEATEQQAAISQAIIMFPEEYQSDTREVVLEYLEQELGVRPTTAEEAIP